MELDTILSSHPLTIFCENHPIRQLFFFESVVGDDFGPQSDIDMLVEFASRHTRGFDFFLMEVKLFQLLGHKVNIEPPNFLRSEIRRSVLLEAVSDYEQAYP